MISASQIKAARALLNISATKLSELCGIGQATLKRYELQVGIPQANISTLFKIKSHLESQGIEFTGDPLKNPGVILHLDKQSSHEE
jgi:transcriptional regulator with XRE-family HTH domain